MSVYKFFRLSALATMFAGALFAGSAFADRDGKGGGGGNRGGSGGGDRGSSSRSSSGSSDRSSSRSSSRSSDSNRSSSSGGSSRSRSDSPSVSRGSDNRGSDNKTIQPPKSFQPKQDASDARSRSARDYEALRPSDDKAREMLKQGDNRDKNRNADRYKDRSPKDREIVDREYNKWRTTWNGDRDGKGDRVADGKNRHDHRDWSGSWRNSDRFNTADRIRNDWRHRKNNDYVFNDRWWNNRYRGNYWNFWGDYGRRNRNPYYWWAWTTGAGLGSWYTFNWPQPYYWDYGQGEYIYANNGVVYVNGQWYQPAPVFYQQTTQLIDQSAQLTDDAAAKLEWLPLGVFAVTPDGLNEPDVTLQLATTKEGQIGGTAFDSKSGAAYNIQGTVDKKTQRAVWSYTTDKNQRIMMETSVYNLTQPEATGLVHYGPEDMRVVELVRLQQPDAESTNSPSLPAPPVSQ